MDASETEAAQVPGNAAEIPANLHSNTHDNARTRAAQGAFLAAYGVYSRVDVAAKAADISRGSHYNWLRKDPEYAAMFEETEQLAAQNLMDEAVRRALEGVEEPTTVAGEKTMVRKYSDRLLERLLEARFPVLFRSNLAHRLVDKEGKDRELLPLEALDKLVRAADSRDKEQKA